MPTRWTAIRDRLNPAEHCPECGAQWARTGCLWVCPHCGFEDQLEDEEREPRRSAGGREARAARAA